MAKKVLVRSVYRHVVAKVGEHPVRLPSGDAVMEAETREFRDFMCYMSPEEAHFLVESGENAKARAAGKPRYYYPAGIPVPVDVNHDGPLAPAGSASSFIAADPTQSIAAKVQMERAARMLAAQDRALNAPPVEKNAPEKATEKPVSTADGK